MSLCARSLTIAVKAQMRRCSQRSLTVAIFACLRESHLRELVVLRHKIGVHRLAHALIFEENLEPELHDL
eukprot:2424246-Rhodomonas_salina.1